MKKSSPKLKMLIVDDAFTNRILLSEAFDDDFEILMAENGEVALDLLHKNKDVAIVLLDLIMPIIDGFSVLQAMIEDSELCEIPVVVVTSADEIENQVRAFDLGAADILTKPLNIQLIRHRIRNIIARSSQKLLNDDKRVPVFRKFLSEQVHDSKTGLFNRNSFCKKTREVIDKNPKVVFVIFRIDIDGFKVINDVYGISEGDRCLSEMANMFRGFEADNTVFGRWEADHYVGCMPMEDFNRHNVANTFTSPINDSRFDFDVTRRMGVYVVENRELDISLMCDRALLALKSIKGKYESHVAYYSEDMRQELIESQQIVNEMNAALDDGQFIIYIQPQFNYDTNKLHGGEALVRWKHPNKGIIMPGKFVPIFEKNGFITHLDQFVWEEVCKLQRKWLDEGRAVVPISVNVSRMDIASLRLVDHFVKLIGKYEIPTELLRIEITESAYMDNPSQMIETVSRLREAGFSVEMDDFGSGYSSLNTLKDVTVDMLKLDMKFIEGGKNAERGGSILSSVIRMSNRLNLAVLAEGVETKEQAEYLKSIGCIYMQGYYFARPMPVNDYERILTGKEHELPIADIDAYGADSTVDFLNASVQSTLIFNSFVGGTAIIGFDGEDVETLRVNEKFFEAISADRDKFNEGDFSILDDLNKENKAKLFETFNNAASEGVEKSCEVMYTRDGKEEVYVCFRVRCLETNGEKHLLYIMVENVTERVLLVKNNIRLTNRISDIMNKVPAGIAEFEIAGDDIHILFHNDFLPEIYGYTPEEYEKVVMPDVVKTFHPDDITKIMELAKEAKECGLKKANIRFRHTTLDAGYKWALANLVVTHIISGRIYVTGIIEDIDERVAMETRLSIQEKRYERQRLLMDSVFSSIPCPVMQFYHSSKDDAYLLVNCNDAAYGLFGYNEIDEFKKDINGKKNTFISEKSKDFFDTIEDLTSGKIDHCERGMIIRKRDGSEQSVKDYLSRIVFGDQVFVQHIIITEDK
ncbi:MAG: EAL domain-containing protein [Lachnospiraceae bacterium]|nr:EAL domain-containing protein [Lachnospiraceae bacterium]